MPSRDRQVFVGGFARAGLGRELASRLPGYVREIMKTLNASSYRAHAVGGCLRDLILGYDPLDWDVATDARPHEVMELFPGNSVPTGIKHGTVTIVTGGRRVEVTTYRVEGLYRDHRRPSTVRFTREITEDIARRDFTMNSIAVDLEGNLVDPFEGIRDIERGVIRAVGDPGERFREDALRMLRAVRFASQLGFRIERATLSGIRENRRLICHVSRERVGAEILKCLTAGRAMFGLRYLVLSGLWPEVFPELGDVLSPKRMSLVWRIGKILESLPREEGTRLAALFVCSDRLPRKRGMALETGVWSCLDRLRTTRKVRKRVTAVVSLWESILNGGKPLSVFPAAAGFRAEVRRELAGIVRTWAILEGLWKWGGGAYMGLEPRDLLELSRALRRGMKIRGTQRE